VASKSRINSLGASWNEAMNCSSNTRWKASAAWQSTPLLKPAQRRIAGQFRVAFQRRLPGQIAPQRLMVIEVLVAQRQPVMRWRNRSTCR
jgi:hypothetical protein